MKYFTNVREAQEYSEAGHQALHVYGALPMKAPAVFKRHKEWAHLFDLDIERLTETTKRLGVRVIVVDHRGRRGQHTDLCGKPLEKAKGECEIMAGLSEVGFAVLNRHSHGWMEFAPHEREAAEELVAKGLAGWGDWTGEDTKYLEVSNLGRWVTG